MYDNNIPSIYETEFSESGFKKRNSESNLLLLYDTVHCSIDAPKIVMNHISVYICRLAGSSAHMHAWWTGGLGPLR